ncbi:Ribosomal-protein-alanine acetyltransferase [bioreactor metagenome]|uniref:Ribosomal-protein-alanine acetyltransferase n=1 Tax=bioreactor metagenome TaxID=1076179 RepID=A0A644SUS5_9ZZZZ|nr:ribosomal protein S18-alanine N-acetyltransferase [Methanobrevibacter sp.]MEA4956171.1 ribosomal protein S18-alanine N-acetyltransferase [Methanobrevibacter sp.]
MSIMIIREFRLDDLNRVYEIEKITIPNPYDMDILRKLFDFGAGFLVAQIKDTVVGYIIFWIVEEDRGHVISLAVDPDYKRQKVGSRLINTAIATFMKFNIFNITLEVNAKNKDALNFYKSIGFKSNKKVSNYYEDGSDAYKMSFELFNNTDI